MTYVFGGYRHHKTHRWILWHPNISTFLLFVLALFVVIIVILPALCNGHCSCSYCCYKCCSSDDFCRHRQIRKRCAAFFYVFRIFRILCERRIVVVKINCVCRSVCEWNSTVSDVGSAITSGSTGTTCATSSAGTSGSACSTSSSAAVIYHSRSVIDSNCTSCAFLCCII